MTLELDFDRNGASSSTDEPEYHPEDISPITSGDGAPSGEQIFGLLGDAGFGRVLDRTFEMIRLAEEEIDRYKEEYPDVRNEIDDAFPMLRPNDLLLETHEEVYRSHAAELLTRIGEAGSIEAATTETATDAECLVAMKEASLSAPLPRRAFHAYGMLMERTFLSMEEVVGEGVTPPSPSNDFEQGEAEKLIGKVRREVTRNLDRD
jgi:hypothetical protein